MGKELTACGGGRSGTTVDVDGENVVSLRGYIHIYIYILHYPEMVLGAGEGFRAIHEHKTSFQHGLFARECRR